MEEKRVQTSKSKKLAALLGEQVDLIKVSTDKNAEARSQLVKTGYQLPPSLARSDSQQSLNLDVNELLDLHREMPDVFTARFSAMNLSNLKSAHEASCSHFNLVVDFEHCIFSVGENTEMFCSLYSEASKTFITEEYCVKLTAQGFPQLGAVTCRAMFVDITQEELDSRLHVVCRIYRLGALVWKSDNKKTLNPSDKKSDECFKRPWGVSVLPLNAVLDRLLAREGEEVKPPKSEIFVPPAEKDFTILHEMIIANDTKRDVEPLNRAKNAIGIAMGLRIISGNSTLPDFLNDFKDLAGISLIPKLEYPGPAPGETRHELCLTLLEGTFAFGLGSKKSEKNVQVKIQLRDQNMVAIPDCIVRGRGPMAKATTSYESSVYYHLNAPVFKETISISLPPQKVMENCHIYIEFAHCSTSEKIPTPFAFCYMPIINPRIYTVIKNGGYSLTLYEYSKKLKFSSGDNYLLMETEARDRLASRERFFVSTELRSTVTSQDIDVHQLLNWHRSPRDQRASVLRSITRKPSSVICRCLNAIMEKLIEILTSSNKDYAEHHSEVFATLVNVISTVGARTSKHVIKRVTNPTNPLDNCIPYLEHYISKVFSSVVLWRPFLKYWGALLEWVNSDHAQQSDAEFDTLSHCLKGKH